MGDSESEVMADEGSNSEMMATIFKILFIFSSRIIVL